MTIINCVVSFARDQAMLVSDSLMGTFPGREDYAAKVIAYPHLKMVAAGAGLHVTSWDWKQIIHDAPSFRDLVDVVGAAPAHLRELHDGRTILTTIWHVGVDRDGKVSAYVHRSEYGFEPERLAPGTVWMHPGLGDGAAAPRMPVELTPELAAPLEDAWPGPSWHELTSRALRAVEGQQRERKVLSGGPLLLTHLWPDGISQRWVRDLVVAWEKV